MDIEQDHQLAIFARPVVMQVNKEIMERLGTTNVTIPTQPQNSALKRWNIMVQHTTLDLHLLFGQNTSIIFTLPNLVNWVQSSFYITPTSHPCIKLYHYQSRAIISNTRLRQYSILETTIDLANLVSNSSSATNKILCLSKLLFSYLPNTGVLLLFLMWHLLSLWKTTITNTIINYCCH